MNSRFYTYIRNTDKLFLLLLLFFIALPLYHFSYVPIWDGWQFSKCYMAATITGSLSCFEHSSQLHTSLFSLPQRIDLGNFKLIYAMNLILGVIGVICLRSLLKYLFEDRLSTSNINLLTMCFGLNPVFLAHIIQPSLDFTLPIYLIILLLLLFRSHFLFAGAIGVLMMFTKETGIMLYEVSVGLFITFKLYNDYKLLKNKKWIIHATLIFFLPLLLFAVYMLLVPHTQIGDSWVGGIEQMFKFYLLNRVIFAQLASLFVINFTWIITGFVLLNFVIASLNLIKHPGHLRNVELKSETQYYPIYFYLILILFCYFLTRIPFYNNPRYMLPALPVLILLFGYSLINVLRRQLIIKITLIALLVLIATSTLRTLDPVSKKIFGTFKFGSHEMLHMSRFNDKYYNTGYGRDQLVYNFEFTQFHYITEKILNKKHRYAVFVIAPNATWISDLNSLDIVEGKRAIYGKNVYKLPMLFPDQILNLAPLPKEIYYISYPNFDKDKLNEKMRAKLSLFYELKEVNAIENSGYKIDLYHYARKK